MSVNDVGNKFGAWYDAHKALVAARRSLDVTLSLQQSGYYFSPGDISLLYYKLEVAGQARDAAVQAVKDATGVSVVTLLAAGFTCGAAVVAPTL
jgi:hypothetical protein